MPRLSGVHRAADTLVETSVPHDQLSKMGERRRLSQVLLLDPLPAHKPQIVVHRAVLSQ